MANYSKKASKSVEHDKPEFLVPVEPGSLAFKVKNYYSLKQCLLALSLVVKT